MLKTMLPLVLSGLVGIAAAQPAQITVTNVAADSVLKGLYNRSRYQASTAIDKVSDIAPDMFQQVSADSLSSYLNKLVTFYNRNSGSDTVSTTTGIGAARRWVYSKFQEFSAQSGNRLLPSYLQFNQTICSVARHRDIFAVLPGRDTSNHSILIVEGHMDSRCENNCDITCKAHGADDNGSGTVLTMELARVLSKYTFNQTLVFLVTMGEEQSLYGANAFATYCKNSSIPVKAVQNNDVVGGIICGPSSSPPSCPTKGAKDSTHIRIFSLDTNFSMHKAYARFVKGQYEKWLKPTAPIPMEIMIMSPVDRTGRGGDHQPFSDIGMTAVRFTESYENGNGGATSGRQHTTRDVISEGDTMFVNFEYLRRNTQINAIGLIGAALGPQSPDLTLTETTQHNVQVTVTGSTSPVGTYKIAVRTTGNNDFAVVYTLQGGTTFLLPNTVANTTYYVAVAAMDGNDAQSLYSQEKSIRPTGNSTAIRTLPRSFSTSGVVKFSQRVSEDRISWIASGGAPGLRAELNIRDMQGNLVRHHAFTFTGPTYEVALFRNHLSGAFVVSLEMTGKLVDSKRLLVNSSTSTETVAPTTSSAPASF